MSTKIPRLLVSVLLVVAAVDAAAQDLEPRRWTPLPPGLNVFGAGVVDSNGDVYFDPGLRVEDATIDAQSIGLSYVRSLKLGGKLARLDLVLPWQHIRYAGLLDGEPATAVRVGLMDPSARLSVILAGADPEPGAKSNTVVGAAIAVIAPLGEYSERYLLNLGQNRWTFRPQLGFVHTRGRWSYELTGSVFFFTDNDEFYGGSTREQDPVVAMQGHVIYAFRKPGYWAAISAGYGARGETLIDGNRVDDEMRLRLMSLSYGMPLGKTQSLKFAYLRTRTNTNKGSDVDSLGIAWSLRF